MRSLVIGYGDPSRRDDGVALHVVNGLRGRWGQPALTPLSDGWKDLGGTRDSLFLRELSPELAATLARYDLAVFVEAALPETAETVRLQCISPLRRPGAIPQQMEPATLLALAGERYGRAPAGFLASVHGHDFGFGDRLSPETAAAVPEAVERIAKLIALEA